MQSQDSPPVSGAFLGDVLYARPAGRRIDEWEWVELVRSVAVRSQTALQSLYDRARKPVFTLAMRLTGNAAAAQEATLETFLDVWHGARGYDQVSTTVLGWIMQHARRRSLERAAEASGRRGDPDPDAPLLEPPARIPALLARRIAEESRTATILPPPFAWSEPDWDEVADGIGCKLLATDSKRHRVSMLVRLAPGAAYPPHTHAGVEELHLLQGELWIDALKLRPGDYNRAQAPSADDRV